MSCENPLRFLFTPYPIPSNLGFILPLFDLAVLLLVWRFKNIGSRGWLLPLVYWLALLVCRSKARREEVLQIVKTFLCFSPRS